MVTERKNSSWNSSKNYATAQASVERTVPLCRWYSFKPWHSTCHATCFQYSFLINDRVPKRPNKETKRSCQTVSPDTSKEPGWYGWLQTAGWSDLSKLWAVGLKEDERDRTPLQAFNERRRRRLPRAWRLADGTAPPPSQQGPANGPRLYASLFDTSPASHGLPRAAPARTAS